MTPEQRKFYEAIWEVSPTLGRWVLKKFDIGFSTQEVKAMLLEAGKLAGREF